MGNSINTLRSSIDAAAGVARFQVRIDDFGLEKVGVHVWDNPQHHEDIPLAWKKKLGSDDVYEAEVPLARLQGFDLQRLGATAFVDIPQGAGADYRLWEQADHRVPTEGRDALADIPSTHPSSLRNVGGHASLSSGTIDLDVLRASKTGYKSAYGHSHLLGARYVDTTNTFGGAQRLELVVIPVLKTVEGRGDMFRPYARVEKDLELRNAMNRLTLERGADGSYTATAPDGKSFASVGEYSIYMGGTGDVSGFKVAIVDPASGRWDSNNGDDYFVSVPR